MAKEKSTAEWLECSSTRLGKKTSGINRKTSRTKIIMNLITLFVFVFSLFFKNMISLDGLIVGQTNLYLRILTSLIGTERENTLLIYSHETDKSEVIHSRLCQFTFFFLFIFQCVKSDRECDRRSDSIYSFLMNS